MNKSIWGLLSILFFNPLAHAESTVLRNAICHFQDKSYILLAPSTTGLKPNVNYVIFESSPQVPNSMPQSLMGSFAVGGKDLQFPPYWRPTSIPLSSCAPVSAQIEASTPADVIREFYVESYFISGDTMPTDPIDVLVKNGQAIPVKVRILCKSDDITDDLTLCKEITITDSIIPVDPPGH